MRTSRPVVAVVTGLVVGTLLVGCGRAAEEVAERAAEQGTGGNVDIGDDSIKIDTEDGSAEFNVGKDELPSDWPSDVPLPDGGAIDSSSSLDQGGTKGWTVQATYSVSPTDLAQEYAAGMKDAGFTQSSRFESGDQIGYQHEGSGLQVVAFVTAGDGGSTLNINVSAT